MREEGSLARETTEEAGEESAAVEESAAGNEDEAAETAGAGLVAELERARKEIDAERSELANDESILLEQGTLDVDDEAVDVRAKSIRDLLEELDREEMFRPEVIGPRQEIPHEVEPPVSWEERIRNLRPWEVAELILRMQRLAILYINATCEAAMISDERIDALSGHARDELIADKVVAWEWFFGPWEGWLPRFALEEACVILQLHPDWVRRRVRAYFEKEGIKRCKYKLPPGYRVELYSEDKMFDTDRTRAKRTAASGADDEVEEQVDEKQEAVVEPQSTPPSPLPLPVSSAPVSSAPSSVRVIDQIVDESTLRAVPAEAIPSVVEATFRVLDQLGADALAVLSGALGDAK